MTGQPMPDPVWVAFYQQHDSTGVPRWSLHRRFNADTREHAEETARSHCPAGFSVTGVRPYQKADGSMTWLEGA